MKFRAKATTQYLTFHQEYFAINKTIIEEIPCLGKSCKGLFIKRFDLNKQFGRCKRCDFKAIFFKPTPIQALVIACQNLIVNTSSGTGGGKTIANAFKVYQHLSDLPGTRIVIAAMDWAMIDQVGKEELITFFDEKKDFLSFTKEKWVLRNKSEILFFSMRVNDPDKLRGRTISLAWLVEAQTISEGFYRQFQSRLRNPRALKYDDAGNIISSRLQIILESNVKEGSFVENVIRNSHTIIASATVDHHQGVINYLNQATPVDSQLDDTFIKDIVTILWTPLENVFLPEKTLLEMTSGKDERYVAKEFWCKWFDLDNKVYPNWKRALIFSDELPPYHSNKDWLFCESADFSYSLDGDASAYALFIWNPKLGQVIFLDGFCQERLTTNEEVNLIRAIRKRNGFQMNRSYFFVGDPSGFKKDRKYEANNYSPNSYAALWVKAGLSNLKPAFKESSVAGSQSILVGIDSVREKMNNGRLRFLASSSHIFEKEFNNYVMIPFDKKNPTKTGRPRDRHNHFCDALRYAIQHLSTTPNMIDPNVLKRIYHKKDIISRRRSKIKRVIKNPKPDIFGVW